MAWIDVKPPTKSAAGTGVRMSHTERHGVTLTLGVKALAALGCECVSVQFDADPALPRMRLAADDAGRFRLKKSPRGTGRVLRLGRQDFLPAVFERRLDCLWELDGEGAIIIDVPREFRSVTTVTRAVGRTGEKQVTLPAVKSLQKERA